MISRPSSSAICHSSMKRSYSAAPFTGSYTRFGRLTRIDSYCSTGGKYGYAFSLKCHALIVAALPLQPGEADDFLGEFLRLLELRLVAGLGDGDDPRARDELGVGLEILLRDDAVRGAAQQGRRPVDGMQPVLQLRIVHEGLPGDERQCLPVARDGQQLLVALGPRIELPFLRRVV